MYNIYSKQAWPNLNQCRELADELIPIYLQTLSPTIAMQSWFSTLLSGRANISPPLNDPLALCNRIVCNILLEVSSWFSLSLFVFSGDAGVGKTSIVRRYTDGVFTSAGIPTIGVDFCIKTLSINGSAIKVIKSHDDHVQLSTTKFS